MDQEPGHWSEKPKQQRSPASPFGPSGPSQPRRARRPEPRPRADPAVRKIVWIVLAVVVCAAAGVSAYLFWFSDSGEAVASSTTAAPTTTTEAPPPLGKSYESPTLGCSFSYPEEWVEFPADSSLGASVNDPTAFLVGDPTTTDAAGSPTESVMFIGRRWPGEVPPSARSVVDAMIADFNSVGSPDSMTVLYEPATDLLVNGMEACSWTSRDRGKPEDRMTRTVVITSGDGSYVFEFRCPKERMSECQTVFDAILVSFRPSSYSLLQEISSPSDSPTAFSNISKRCSSPPARSSRSMVAMVM